MLEIKYIKSRLYSFIDINNNRTGYSYTANIDQKSREP